MLLGAVYLFSYLLYKIEYGIKTSLAYHDSVRHFHADLLDRTQDLLSSGSTATAVVEFEITLAIGGSPY